MATLQLETEAAVAAPAAVLFVGPSSRDRGAIADKLAHMGHSVTRAGDAAEALRMLAARPSALCLVDLADEPFALALARAVRAQHPHLAIAGIVDPSRPLTAVEAIHAGISDLLPWPFDERDVATMVANARDRTSVGLSHDGSASAPAGLFAYSPAMRAVVNLVRSAAEGRGNALICGEPGSGREVIARAIHAESHRPGGAFVTVECETGSPEELELCLFGLQGERSTNGSPRRASERIARASAVFQARGGTLFLANVVEAPARIQAKLARLLRDGEAMLAEKRAVIDLDLRTIGATDPIPEAAVADGRLRRDLCERLSHVRIDVPALRRRREDIPLLAGHFLQQISEVSGRLPPRFSRSALALLSALPWPGNARELRALLETLMRSTDRPVIGLDDLLDHVRLDGIAARVDPSGTLRDARVRFERDWISAVLVKHHGRVGDAARALGIQRTNLYRKVRQLNVTRGLLAPRRSSG